MTVVAPGTGVETGGTTCRVTVVAPRVRLDVVLPTGLPLAHLMPTLLWHAGEQAVEAGAAHGGWRLQRLAGEPFDTARTLTDLGVRDGEILYFRPAGAALPEAVYDDPVDGIGAVLRDRPGRWTPAATRVFSLIVMALIPTFGVAPLLAHGPAWSVPALIAGVAALVLALAAGGFSRAVGDSAAGACCAVAAIPYAALAGFLAPLGTRQLGEAGAASATGAGAAAFAVGILAAAFVGVGMPPDVGDTPAKRPGYVLPPAATAPTAQGSVTSPPREAAPSPTPPHGALILAAIIPAAAVAGTGSAALRWTAEGCAASAAALVLALMTLIPRIAYRAAGLPPAAVSLSADDLRRLSVPLPAGRLAPRAVLADRIVTGATAGSALAVAACAGFALHAAGWTPLVLAAIVAALLAMRARLHGGTAQRAWLLGASLALAAVTAAVAPHRIPAGVALAVALGIAALLSVFAGQLAVDPLRRFAPPWSRAADVLELIGLTATVPLALLLLGVFGAVRALAG